MTKEEKTVVLNILDGDPISRLSSTNEISSQDLLIVARPEWHDVLHELVDTENFLSDIIMETKVPDISNLITEKIGEIITRLVHLDYKLPYENLSTQLLNDVSARFGFKSMAYHENYEYARRIHAHDYSKVRCYPSYTSADIINQYSVPPVVQNPHDLEEWIGTIEIYQLSTLCVGNDFYGRGILSDCYIPISTDIYMPHIEFPKYDMPTVGDTRFIIQSNNNIHVEVLVPEPEKMVVQNHCEICFLVDSTSSMSTTIKKVKENIVSFFDNLVYDVAFTGKITDWRAKIVWFKDKENDNPWYKDLGFKTNSEAIRLDIESIVTAGGDDPEESLFDAIIKLINETEWTESTEAHKNIKIVVAMTDAASKGSNSDAYNKLRDNGVHLALYAPNWDSYDYFFNQSDSNQVMIETGSDSSQKYASCAEIIKSVGDMLDILKVKIIEKIQEDIPDLEDIDTTQEDVEDLELYYDSETDGYWAHPYGQTIECGSDEFIEACKIYGNNGKTGKDTSFTVPSLNSFIKMNPNIDSEDPMKHVDFKTGLSSHVHTIEKESIEYDTTIVKILASIPTDHAGGSGLGNVIHSGYRSSMPGNITEISCEYTANELFTRTSVSDTASYRGDQEPFPVHQKIPLMIYIGSK